MGRVSEPEIYSGFVISMIGQDMGKRIPMDYAVAQSCVANGTARWDDDETPLTKHQVDAIAEREALREAEVNEDARIHDERLAAQKAASKSVEAVLREKAEALVLAKTEDGTVYLARPFPEITILQRDLLDLMGVEENPAIIQRDDDAIEIKLANAEAVYVVIEDGEKDLVLQHEESIMPEVDIPADWRELSHLQTIPLAKKIRALPNNASMKKAEAEAIIEEWVTVDDPISTEATEQPKGGAGTEGHRGLPGEEGNRDGKDFDPAEEAKKAERALLDDGDGDVSKIDEGQGGGA